MLVCNVSLRPPRRAIAAELAEVGAAVDALGTGNVVFATLVDDPASVGEIVDAYLGEIMLEAASADALADGNVPAVYAVAVAEAATATDTQSVAAAGTTWDAATITAVTLSGGGLVVTNTGTSSTDQGAHVASTSGKTTGKYYFEVTWTNLATAGTFYGVGIGTPTSTYTNMGAGNGVTGVVIQLNGNIYANGTGIVATGAKPAGSVIELAIDLDNRKAWIRAAASPNWNGSGTANPATNTGGVTIPAGTMVPFCTFGGSGAGAGNVMTANFGASAFTGAVPSGFTSGWPP